MMDYPWSKFQEIRAMFWGERAKKPPKKGPFHGCCIAMKTFENLQFNNDKWCKDETYHDYVSS